MSNFNANKLFGETDKDLVRNFFNMTKKEVEDGLNNIIDWYKMQPFFPEQPYDLHVIEKLYSWNKYSVEKTKLKLEALLISRATFPEIFSKRDPIDEDVLSTMQTVQLSYVPVLSPQNYRVFVYRYTDVDPKYFNANVLLKILFMAWDIKLHHDYSLGDIYICDYKHFKLGHALKITPSIVKKSVFITQDCYSIMIKQIHILNLPNYGKTLINTLKAIMKKKMSERIIVHESEEDLHKYLPPECIPKDYGGIADSCIELNDGLCKNMMQSAEWKKWFEESEKKVADLKIMPEKEQNKVGDALGIAGSFRMLEID